MFQVSVLYKIQKWVTINKQYWEDNVIRAYRKPDEEIQNRMKILVREIDFCKQLFNNH